MGLAQRYPIKFNNTEMLTPSKWAESSEVIENVNTGEAGNDIVEVIRYDKLSISVSYQLAETMDENGNGNGWVKILKDFSKESSIDVRRYDPSVGAYEVRTMRMRKFKATLVGKSAELTAVNGVWTVSFSLEEF